jgi:hypothetical protein
MSELQRQKRGGKRRLDQALIAALARGLSAREVAALCEVSQRTVERRMQDVGFRRLVVAARDKLVSDASGLLAGYLGDAVRVLHSTMMEADDGKLKVTCDQSSFRIVPMPRPW